MRFVNGLCFKWLTTELYKVSLGIKKTEIMKKEIDSEEMIKRLGLDKKPKLNLYGVVKRFFVRNKQTLTEEEKDLKRRRNHYPFG